MSERTFSEVLATAVEILPDASYRWDNAVRTDGEALVIQRTIAGVGFIERAAERILVPSGFAMLFTHKEDTSYGFPAEASEPYRQEFIAFLPTPGVCDLFGRLREDFGPVVRIPETSESTDCFIEIVRRFSSHTFRDRYHQSELLVRLLIALYREQVDHTLTTDPIEFGFHFIHNRFRLPINLKLVVETCGVSREHFIRVFSKRYGEAPGAMLRRLRLKHARAMLCASGVSVEEVALASGFANVDTFYRAFRREYGTSPARARQSLV